MLRLFHATNVKNIDSINKYGLISNNKPSGYGEKPKYNAVYLYCLTNIDVPCDLINVFKGKVAIYEIVNIDENKLIPDEDSNKNTWQDSINAMGTCAYNDMIKSNNLIYCGTFSSEDEYISWIHKVNIRVATINDKDIIRNITLDMDKYYCEILPLFKIKYNSNKNKYMKQSYDFVDKIDINDIYVLEVNNNIVGTISKWDNKGEITLVNFYIKEEYRNKGYGTKLLQKIINNINTNYCVLSVYKDNQRALEFYYKFGFKFIQKEDTDVGELLWLIYYKK